LNAGAAAGIGTGDGQRFADGFHEREY
jgi:hypothetical protein